MAPRRFSRQRAFSRALGVAPRRTIRFALWGGEEEGLFGSKAWVAQHLAGDANNAAREKFDVYFNIDPGYGPVYGFYTEGNPGAKQLFDQWLEPFKDLGARKNVVAGIGNTDHLSFIAEGVPGFNPIQEFSNYDVRIHHTNMDTMERMNPDDIKEAAMIFAAFAYDAAMRDAPIPRVPRRRRPDLTSSLGPRVQGAFHRPRLRPSGRARRSPPCSRRRPRA